MQVLDDVYFQRYQEDSVSERACLAYAEIAEELRKAFAFRNAMDVGCGGGALIKGLLALNKDAYGIEGSSHAVALMPDRIEHHDLRTPYHSKVAVSYGGYDLVTCFDVGEHIEEEYHDIFCDNIQKQMGVRGWLVFGAAGEGQDGLGHVACRTMVYWIGKFQERGFILAPGASEKLRMAIRARENTNFIWWVDKNLMVFHYEGR